MDLKSLHFDDEILKNIKIQGKWLDARFGISNDLIRIACVTSYEKRVQSLKNVHLRPIYLKDFLWTLTSFV